MKVSMWELYHHGVKGMKWGVRRSPKELGHEPPTKAGKRAKAKAQLKSAAVLIGLNIASNVALGLSGRGMDWYVANNIKSMALSGATVVQLGRAGYNYVTSGKYR